MPESIPTQSTQKSDGPIVWKNIKSPIGAEQVKTAAGFLLGAWALKKFPKTAVFGLIGVGVILGITIKEVSKRVQQAPVPKDDLH